MPYVRGGDFTRIRELIETIKELSEKDEYRSVPDIAARALKVMKKYIVELEAEEKK